MEGMAAPAPRILLVEDDERIRSELLVALQGEEMDFQVAVDLASARGHVPHEFDLVLLDLGLPDGSGLELLRELRDAEHGVPVVVVTARDASEDRVMGLDLGADDYVIKPFDLPELLARLRALIRRSAGHPSARARFGNVEIDFNARRVTLGAVEVALTAREYSLVEVLAQHRDRVFTRAQLYEHLFDEMDDSSSNLLDVHVSNVRKKLGKEFIVTRRGHGYCIRTSSPL